MPAPAARTPPIGPSQLASDYEPSAFRRRWTRRTYRRVRSDWVRAAQLSRDAGFDIIYVYGGHSYLPLQFLSPFYNRRTDEYGGSFENRARFWLETLEEVRAAVGDDCAIAVRFCVEALGRRASSSRKGLRTSRLRTPRRPLGRQRRLDPRLVEGLGHVALLRGGLPARVDRARAQVTAKPIVGVGRLTNPDRMAEIVRSGVWDLIGAAPFHLRSIPPQEDRGGPLRRDPRVHRLQHLRRRCRVREPDPLHAERDRRRGVPARLAPRTLRACCERRPRRARRRVEARRHGVRDRSRQARYAPRPSRRGGAGDRRDHALGPRLPGLGEWGRVLNWRAVQLGKLADVEVITGTRLDADGVREYGAELVVVATSARWAGDGVNYVTHAPIDGADASLPACSHPSR